jgi:hypothetical protein
MTTEMILETLVFLLLNDLTWLIARAYSIIIMIVSKVTAVNLLSVLGYKILVLFSLLFKNESRLI